MKYSKIESIVEERYEKMEVAFNNVRMHLDEEEIRLFRVKVKKLAACLHFMNVAKGHTHSLKIPQKITKAYQISGAIRTLQMQERLIRQTLTGKQIASPDTYLQLIAEKILQQIALFNNQIAGLKPLKKGESKLMKLLPEKISEEKTKHFIQSEGDRLATLFEPVFPVDNALHQARRLLKDLLYLSPYLEMDISELSPYILLATYEDINSFTTVLGNFQDINAAIDCLQATCQKISVNEDEKASLRHVATSWIREREALRKKVYEEIDKVTASGRTAVPGIAWPVM
jgi:hypothetical protein